MFNHKLSRLSHQKPTTIFQFKPRWKEELLVTGPDGSFVLDLPMGVYSAYLPNEENWWKDGPVWARDLWPILRPDLKGWCKENRVGFHISDTVCVLREG